MVRRVPLLLLVAVTVAVVTLAGFVLAGRPALSRARDKVDAQWSALREPLALRYLQLEHLVTESRKALGPGEDRTPLSDARQALVRWQRLRVDSHPSVNDEVFAANSLEATATRVKSLIADTSRLHDAPPVRDAQNAFDGTDVTEARKTYDAAVREYERARHGLVRRMAVALLGYKSRPLLEPDA